MSAMTFPQSDYPDTPELKPHTKLLLSSDLARAVLLFVAGSIAFAFCKLAFSMTIKEGLPSFADILTGILWIGFIAAGLVSTRAILQLFGSNLQALAEIIVREDLNNSGQIGDVTPPHQIDQPPAKPNIEYRIIPGNIKSDGVPVQLGEEKIVVSVPDLKVVVLDGDLLRSHWLGEKDASPIEPFKGKQNARQYYDAVMKILDNAKLTIRGSNNSRQLMHSGGVTWSMLGLD